jgi:N-acetyl-1-D-myo-inositol-2-amino-2-deoxy-alpha-D-glucopyranoside deacetylase
VHVREVVGVAILEQGRLLAARREHPPALAGRWELPGGKVEPGEALGAAAVREVEEELGCRVGVTDVLATRSPIDDELVLRAVVARLVDGDPVPREHDAVRWLRADELDEVTWARADVPFLEALASRIAAMDKHLLLVHAHPDDESIGQGATMARYAAEGVGVTLVTCTGGEMGEILVPELAHLAADRDDTLADQRRIELDNAMKALGVTDHRYLGGFKRYRDSGMQWHDSGHAIAADDVHENAFWNADLVEAAGHLVQVIREVRPQVMVTYDEFGGYGHPDHIQAHRVATYAAALAAVPSYRRDLGEAHDIAKIYWGAMSASRVRQGLRDLRAAGDTTTFEGMDPDGDLPAFMVEDADLTAVVEADDYVGAKMDAMRAHATQIAVDGPFFALSNNKGNEIWGTEFYRIAKGTPAPDEPDGLETDLFAGLG